MPTSGRNARAATAPAGSGFTVTPGDLHFILKQIQIAERHARTYTAAQPCATLIGPDPDQIPDPLTSYGLRTVDGSCNNLIPGRERFSAADEVFPRLTKPVFRSVAAVPGFPVPSDPSYQGTGNVVDTQPRVISNLIVDQTSTNPAAVQAAGFPVRSQLHPTTPVTFPCTTDPVLDVTPTIPGVPAGCTPQHSTLFIPNVTTDVGLSPPYNSLFTFFGQFFDHGVDQTVKSGSSVFVPLKPDDPLITLGPDGKAGTGDEVPPSQAFMILTRAQNQPGGGQEATNTDTPWVDQSQTYTSHASHQVFLREYVKSPTAGKPVSTGKLLGGLNAGDPDAAYPTAPDGRTGMATWASVKKQARDLLGLKLVDADVTNIPMLAVDPYGKFIPGPARGLPQYVTTDHGLVEGNTDAPVPVPADVRHFDTPFLTDIAHNADPSPVDTDHNPATPPVAPVPDADNTPSADFAHQPPGTYDDEMLNAHFCAGDGRVNENIALTTIHQIFHSEHDRLVDDINDTLSNSPAVSAEDKAAWHAVGEVAANGTGGYDYGERLFQAARFITEMEYQHLVFEEFARKVQPAIRPFHLYHTDINAAIPAEFAHAVYRFGHSMLDDDVARTNESPDGTKTDNSLKLLDAFLNPPEYQHNGTNPAYTPEQAAGAIVMGSSDQVGNELDEFVTETLRNNLLGLPLDLATINMARGRETGIPPLNQLRKQLNDTTGDAQVAPYTDWSDFGQHLKHPESLINFVAAYGKHPTITSQTTVAGRRAAARAIVDPLDTDTPPADAADFMFSNGVWANRPPADGSSTGSITGLDDVDLWVGGLAEVTNLFGGLLGSTFNYVFQHTLENLQDGDRLYYLARTPGLNLRTQLEGNSFSELIQRNTDGTHTLKADAFATADCKFELKNLAGTPAGFTAGGSVVNDDANSDCDESQLLLRKPDGTIQYRAINTVDPAGINGQSVYNGVDDPLGVDRIFGGNDNDTFWGNGGNDIIEGNGGDDVVLGGPGDDRETDLDGADTLKGGPGNDYLNGGPGDDIFMGGDGIDVINGGPNDNESFAGPGNDFMRAGEGADAVFGDGGDDWIQGGSGQDLLQGDHGAPFFDDPGEQAPGNDIFVGEVGENDYDSEGGDDLMAQNSAIDRNAGSGGFDWAFHQYDTVGADDDMAINNNLLGKGLPLVVNRDRWQETEADSGSRFDDVIRGDDEVPSTVGGAGFTGCDALDQTGVNRISGLAALLPQPLTGNTAAVVAASAMKFCPLSGPTWGEGNILLGGGGSDTITGRGGDDVIDGDRSLRVRISVRNDAGAEIGSTDLIQGQYQRDAAGNPTGPTLEASIANGTIKPANLVMVREIIPAPAGDAGVDTAVFLAPLRDPTSGALNYTITPGTGGKVTVTQTAAPVAPQKISDGVDTLTGIEKLQFTDGTVTVLQSSSVTPTSLTFADQGINTTSAAQVVTVKNTGLFNLSIASVAVTGTNATEFTRTTTCGATLAPDATCTASVTFRPTATGTRSAILRITDNSGGVAGSIHDVPLTGTGVVNIAPTGVPQISDATPAPQQLLSVITSSIRDANGPAGVLPGPFTYQWFQTPVNATTPVTAIAAPAGTASTFRVPQANSVGRRYQVSVTYTDAAGFSNTVTSNLTNPVTPQGGGAASTAPTTSPPPVAAATTAPATVTVAPTTTASTGLTVGLAVPPGATTVVARVFALAAGNASTAAVKKRRRLVATVVHKLPKGRHYRLRMTQTALRHLRPGRYQVEVRVGTSRTHLGPARSYVFTVKKAKKKNTRA